MKAVSNLGGILVQATAGQGGRDTVKSCIHSGTANVETISDRANEIGEMLTQQKADFCCFQ